MQVIISFIISFTAALLAAYKYIRQRKKLTDPDAPYHSFHPGTLWRDDQGVHINAHGGGIIIANNRYYWFGEHKIKGEAGNVAHVGVHCYSSTDLYNWKDEGVALKVDKENKNSDLAEGCIIERPKVIYNQQTGMYVMWFHHERKGKGYNTARVGVATSKSITGPYRYLAAYRPNAGIGPIHNGGLIIEEDASMNEAATGQDKAMAGYFMQRDFAGGQMSRDMTIFHDDDGKAYLFSTSEENYTLHIHQLNDDFTGFNGKWTRIFPGELNEAPAVFKKDGNYYLLSSGCTYWDPNAARSAVASSIWGPWTALGNPCVGDDALTTFHSQSTYVLPVPGYKDAFIFMADRWKPRNAIDGRYIWLPVSFQDDKPVLKWLDKWDLSVFSTLVTKTDRVSTPGSR